MAGFLHLSSKNSHLQVHYSHSSNICKYFLEAPCYFEMKEGSILSKLWSGFISRPKQSDCANVSISDMTYVQLNEQIYIASISKDNKLKFWSLKVILLMIMFYGMTIKIFIWRIPIS